MPLNETQKLATFENYNRIFMSFQAYLTNIQAKTGKSPEDFRKLAEQKGFTQKGKLTSQVKAADIIHWLKQDFSLGHGHAMAIYALLKGVKNEKSA